MYLQMWKSPVLGQRVESVNISESGVYFTTDCPLYEGEVVDLTLDMPEALTGEQATKWRCTGHVVYVQRTVFPRDALGVGVQFDCYEVSRAVKTVPECAGEER